MRSIQSKLLLYGATPPNGLAIYCGNCTNKAGKEKKLSMIFEPLLPLQHSLYQCDSQFHTKLLRDQFTATDVWGFIVIGGDGVSFHTLRGNTRSTIYKWFSVTLPKKHGRGGQSKQRFERIRDQKRGWYISEVAHKALQFFIDKNTTLPNIIGLVIAGFADLKHELAATLDQRLAKIITCVVDVQYIGDSGFRSAIELVHSKLSGLKYVKEQKLIEKLFESIATNGNYCFGFADTMWALEAGTVDTLIVWDKLEYIRLVLKSKTSSDKKIQYILPKQQHKLENWEVLSDDPLLDWILDNYKSFGAKIELVSDNSSVGNQFAHGFGGVAGFLRYKIQLPSELESDEQDTSTYEEMIDTTFTDMGDFIVEDNSEDDVEGKTEVDTEENTESIVKDMGMALDVLNIDSYVDTSKEHLNIVFIGHVDAGKSTLSGRILYDTNMVDRRSIEQYTLEAKKNNRGSWFLAYILDTNAEERNKGKTVEVGRATFNTKNKRFTILDTPGHKNYIPNMIMGTSQADIAILVISARNGEFEAGFELDGQTREHCVLAKSMGVKKLIVVINKMDDETVQWSCDRYTTILAQIKPFLKQIKFNLDKDVIFVPASGFEGLNIKDKITDNRCNWYNDLPLLEILDNLEPNCKPKFQPLRIPILDKYKENGKTYILGKVESGIITDTSNIVIYPAKQQIQVIKLENDEGRIRSAECGENVKIIVKTLPYEDNIITTGSVVSLDTDNSVVCVNNFNAMIQFTNIINVVVNGYKCTMHIHMIVMEVTIYLEEELSTSGETLHSHPKFVCNNSLVKAKVIAPRPCVVEKFNSLTQLGRFVVRADGKTIGFGKII